MIYELKKDSWIAKLTFKTWGVSHEDFTHICPFFWLALGTVMLFPITFIILLVKYLCRFYIEIGKEKENVNFKWAETYYNWLMTDEKALSNFMSTFYKNKNSQVFKFYNNYSFIFDFELYKKCCEIYSKYNEDKQELENNKRIERKQKINKIVRYIKPISNTILYLLAILSIFSLGFTMAFLYNSLTSITYLEWMLFLKKLGILLLILVFGFIAVYFIKGSVKENGILNWIGKKLYSAGSAIFIFINIFFEENCPPVKWK